MQNIQDLRPEKFTLKEMDDELHSMALIRSLPDEYKSLSQSLMLHDDLNKTKIREAFLAEETNSQRRGEQTIAGTVTRHVCESVQNVTARLREAKTRYQTARVRCKQLSILRIQ